MKSALKKRRAPAKRAAAATRAMYAVMYDANDRSAEMERRAGWVGLAATVGWALAAYFFLRHR
jgi:hypothetical protein